MEKLEYKLTPEYLRGALEKARKVPLEDWTFLKTEEEPYGKGEPVVEETIVTKLNGGTDLSIIDRKYFRRILCDKSCRVILEGEDFRAEYRGSKNIDEGYEQVHSVYNGIQERIKNWKMAELKTELGMTK